MMSLYIKSTWRSTNKDDMDASGIATFVTSDNEYVIPFNNFTDYFNLVEVIKENGKIAKVQAYKALKSKLDIFIQEIEHVDY